MVHHLIMFFKTTLTVPKIKDLVNSPNQKYQNIFDTISNKTNTYTDIELLPQEESPIEQDSMKDELKSFLKKQLNNDNDTSNITGIESLSNNFSNYL